MIERVMKILNTHENSGSFYDNLEYFMNVANMLWTVFENDVMIIVTILCESNYITNSRENISFHENSGFCVQFADTWFNMCMLRFWLKCHEHSLCFMNIVSICSAQFYGVALFLPMVLLCSLGHISKLKCYFMKINEHVINTKKLIIHGSREYDMYIYAYLFIQCLRPTTATALGQGSTGNMLAPGLRPENHSWCLLVESGTCLDHFG